MDYYCTASAIDFLNRTSPDRIEEYTNYEDEPDERIVIIGDELDTACIMTVDDFQEDSSIFEEKVTMIEYFESGIPDYLLPKRGLTYYYCSWNGRWTFTEEFRK